VVCEVAATTVTVRQPADEPEVAAGERLTLGCRRQAVHLFDAVTAERLP
jgi:hypothetical protein